MPLSDPKCRMVSFRLSASEYANAESVCRSHGFRSLSLFARSAILAAIPGSPQPDANNRVSLEELRNRIEFLAIEIERLSECLNSHSEIAEPHNLSFQEPQLCRASNAVQR